MNVQDIRSQRSLPESQHHSGQRLLPVPRICRKNPAKFCTSPTHSCCTKSMDNNFGPYTYCQCDTVGIASYHLRGGECYIDYSAAPCSWVLDNGCRPPAKKYFTDVSYDANTRTFRGIIDWSDAETNTTWKGHTQWWYRMVFSKDFTIIEKGEVLCFNSTGHTVQMDAFGRNLHYKYSFGPYTYCQYDTVGLASYHLRGGECYIDYSAAPCSWVLDNGCRPPAKKYFTDVSYDVNTRTFRGIIDWSDAETNTTWKGHTQWWYRMVFSEDFTIIEKGEVLCFNSTGHTVQMDAFERDLHYKLTS